MYFKDRVDAGRQLATRLLAELEGESCVVVSLNDGAVIVGAQIASALNCSLTMLISHDIGLPGEPQAIGSMDQDGQFVYSSVYGQSQIDEYTAEFHGHIEQQKVEAFHQVNQLLGRSGVISRDMLRGRKVILVSDGMKDGTILDVVINYLKPIKTDMIITATPIASVKATDSMHMMADQIYCLSVTDNYLDTNHYYERNVMPSHDKIVRIVQNIVLGQQ